MQEPETPSKYEDLRAAEDLGRNVWVLCFGIGIYSFMSARSPKSVHGLQL